MIIKRFDMWTRPAPIGLPKRGPHNKACVDNAQQGLEVANEVRPAGRKRSEPRKGPWLPEPVLR
ncbi:MAG: hypothetical protein JNL17_10055 [Cyclobacteriaceae bacterium]|nr:hypothetical protein [Cyclobacteriaceae bacterium]